MSQQISGFITEYDQYDRLRITFPRIRAGTDAHNTELQLAKKKYRAGWTPVSACSYLAKCSASTFAYDAGRRVLDLRTLVQRTVLLEVDLVDYKGGWYVRVASVRTLD